MWSFITLKWEKKIFIIVWNFFFLFFCSCLECQGHVTAGYSHIRCDSIVSPRCGNIVFVLRMCATQVWVSVFATSLPMRLAHVESCYNKVSLASSLFDDSTTTLLTPLEVSVNQYWKFYIWVFIHWDKLIRKPKYISIISFFH